MERFVMRLNIAHYRLVLEQIGDEGHRERIRQLLKEEEDKLAKFIGSESAHEHNVPRAV